eukprot:scaffold599931_cov20-Prasinocladus_malaysianus.AAC.1
MAILFPKKARLLFCDLYGYFAADLGKEKEQRMWPRQCSPHCHRDHQRSDGFETVCTFAPSRHGSSGSSSQLFGLSSDIALCHDVSEAFPPFSKTEFQTILSSIRVVCELLEAVDIV